MKSLQQFIIEAATEVNGFCILKPGFLDHEDDWYKMLQNGGWQIVQKKNLKMDHDLAANLYSCHKDKDFYNDLVDYMASDNCICCLCHKDCADPIKDMKSLKNKCRDAWGKDEMKNGMHSSDSLDHVKRETKLIFK